MLPEIAARAERVHLAALEPAEHPGKLAPAVRPEQEAQRHPGLLAVLLPGCLWPEAPVGLGEPTGEQVAVGCGLVAPGQGVLDAGVELEEVRRHLLPRPVVGERRLGVVGRHPELGGQRHEGVYGGLSAPRRTRVASAAAACAWPGWQRRRGGPRAVGPRAAAQLGDHPAEPDCRLDVRGEAALGPRFAHARILRRQRREVAATGRTSYGSHRVLRLDSYDVVGSGGAAQMRRPGRLHLMRRSRSATNNRVRRHRALT